MRSADPGKLDRVVAEARRAADVHHRVRGLEAAICDIKLGRSTKAAARHNRVPGLTGFMPDGGGWHRG
jgi:hypothetical protein